MSSSFKFHLTVENFFSLFHMKKLIKKIILIYFCDKAPRRWKKMKWIYDFVGKINGWFLFFVKFHNLWNFSRILYLFLIVWFFFCFLLVEEISKAETINKSRGGFWVEVMTQGLCQRNVALLQLFGRKISKKINFYHRMSCVFRSFSLQFLIHEEKEHKKT